MRTTINRAVTLLFWILLFLWTGVFSAHAESARAIRTAEEQRTIEIYKRYNSSVVFITTRSVAVDPFDFFEDLRPREGSGTGTILDAEQGLVLTNFHVIQSVVQGRGVAEIMLSEGRGAKAKLIGFDIESDLALFRLSESPRGVAGIPNGDSSQLEVGQRVLAIGNPFGLSRTLTQGIISSLDRSMKTPAGGRLRELIQTDAAINPGNSGGPLLDSDGRLIGINTAILSSSGDSAGIGFAVPINQVKRIVPQLLSSGRVRRPQFGWQLVDTDQGPMVLRLQETGPAEKAGVRAIETRVGNAFVGGIRRDIDRADLIVQVNGQRVAGKDDVFDLVRDLQPGEPVSFTLRRGGANGPDRQVQITPEFR
jgi:S1-C subfamily serine protease